MAFAHITEPLGGALINLDRAAAERAGKPVVETIAEVGGWEAPAAGSERYRMLDAALAARGTPFRTDCGRIVFGAWAMVRAAAVFADAGKLRADVVVTTGGTTQTVRDAVSITVRDRP